MMRWPTSRLMNRSRRCEGNTVNIQEVDGDSEETPEMQS